MLVIALIALIAGFSLPVFQGFIMSNQLENNKSVVVSAIRSAQAYSQGISDDSVWGISFQMDTVVVFKGNSYAARDVDFDQVYPLSGTQISGASEITFDKLTGFPDSTANLTLSGFSDSRLIEINEKGAVF